MVALPEVEYTVKSTCCRYGWQRALTCRHVKLRVDNTISCHCKQCDQLFESRLSPANKVLPWYSEILNVLSRDISRVHCTYIQHNHCPVLKGKLLICCHSCTGNHCSLVTLTVCHHSHCMFIIIFTSGLIINKWNLRAVHSCDAYISNMLDLWPMDPKLIKSNLISIIL